jgi:predicted  nucleic acid-binding Zn-ribbon protein
MKKSVSVLVLAFFVVNYFYAQSTEALTNSTIIKMVKAKLSDDLIIDEISSSKVNFNVSIDSVKFLSDENVSSGIIQAMKTANGTQTLIAATTTVIPIIPETTTIASPQPQTAQVKDIVKQPAPKESALTGKEIPTPSAIVPINDPLNRPAKEQLIAETLPSQKLSKENNKTEIDNNNLSEKSSITVNAVSYVIPLAELMIFFDNEFSSLAIVIQVWDKRIRNSIEKGNQIKSKILQVEKEFTDKKNADSKGFTNEIILLKKQLSEYRENYKEFENNMVTDGLKIAKEFEDIGNKLDRSINNKFSEISQTVRKTEPDPSVSEIPKSITIAKQKINDNIVNYVAPVTEMLFCYQNQIISLRDIIVQWNIKVETINKKDSELSKQLEPLEKELINYQLNPKVNKKEISALKKQCSNIDKERKLLTRQMETDSNELSGSLTKICKEVQSSVKERLSDIIENIKYSYQDNFTYRNI